jgi:hypothetical protein
VCARIEQVVEVPRVHGVEPIACHVVAGMHDVARRASEERELLRVFTWS